MLAIIRMIVVLSSICGLSGFALSYLKISTAPRIEEQVLTYVQGPAILKVFADIDNSPIAERKTFTLDGAKVTVFPGKKDGKLVAVALEHFGKGFGGDVGVMVATDVKPRHPHRASGSLTHEQKPSLRTSARRVADPGLHRQFFDRQNPPTRGSSRRRRHRRRIPARPSSSTGVEHRAQDNAVEGLYSGASSLKLRQGLVSTVRT